MASPPRRRESKMNYATIRQAVTRLRAADGYPALNEADFQARALQLRADARHQQHRAEVQALAAKQTDRAAWVITVLGLGVLYALNAGWI